jgi:RNA polymerase sigma-70 factor, ECF subfamily
VAISSEAITGELPGLLRYARVLTRTEDAAADLVQDTVLKALERADQFRGDSAPGTWLHRIMYHRFVDQARRQQAIPLDEAALIEVNDRDWADDAYTVSAEVVLERAEDREALQDALIRLPASYRAAVLLHDLEGITAAGIAEVQQISLAAAKQRLRRGRQLLVSALAQGAERRAVVGEVPLNCWTARSRIGEYLDDELIAADRVRLEKHLAGCPTCPALYASIVGVTGALAAMRDPDSVIPPALAERVRQAVSSRQG